MNCFINGFVIDLNVCADVRQRSGAAYYHSGDSGHAVGHRFGQNQCVGHTSGRIADFLEAVVADSDQQLDNWRTISDCEKTTPIDRFGRLLSRQKR